MTPEQQAERLERAITNARELLSDLNSAGKDLRKTLREARNLAAPEITDAIKAQLETALTALADIIEERQRKAVAKVTDEFERLGAILLGVDQAQPLETICQAVAAVPGRNTVQKVEGSTSHDVDILGVHP